MNALTRAIEACGGTQAGLAAALNIKQQHVWNWINRSGGKVPAEHCRAIEEATGGKVTRYELRPDVFGPEPMKQRA